MLYSQCSINQALYKHNMRNRYIILTSHDIVFHDTYISGQTQVWYSKEMHYNHLKTFEYTLHCGINISRIEGRNIQLTP
jgi:hypothetical protein